MIANRITVMALVALLACAATLTASPGLAQQMQPPVAREKVTMADIDAALARGPVFVEFETQECHYCQQQKPISQGLAGEYAGKATFLFVDAMENRDLAKAFQVSGVPQMSVIVRKAGDKYTYIDPKGNPSDSIGASRFIGLTRKDALKTALDAAITYRK